jgi:DNA-binding transcriptional LysR family regulator
MRRFDPSLTLQKLEVFCLVAESKSVTRTAEKLYVSQPVVSAHLRGLEGKLGVALVRRIGRNIALTDHGERVYKWAKDVMTRTHEMERELAGLGKAAAGSATIAASMSAGSYILPPLITDFYTRHGEGMIQTQISNPQAALDSLHSGACDFAVTILAASQNLAGLEAVPLWEEKLLLACAYSSKRVNDVAGLDDIENLPFVSTPSHMEGQLRAHGVTRRRVIMEFGHPESQKYAVMQDIAVGFFLESCIRTNLHDKGMRTVSTPRLSMAIPLYMVYRQGKTFSGYQKAMMAFIRESNPHGVRAFDTPHVKNSDRKK